MLRISFEFTWDMFSQNERQVAKFHTQVIAIFMFFRFLALKWYIICQGCCFILGPKPIISLRNCFVFYWILTCPVSHLSFSSLVACRSFCENRFHLWLQITNRFVCWNFDQSNKCPILNNVLCIDVAWWLSIKTNFYKKGKIIIGAYHFMENKWLFSLLEIIFCE